MHHISLKVEGLSNACGTIAMLHAILNNRDMLGVLENDCTLGKFYQETKDLSAEERGKALDNSADIGSVHNGLVAEGQSQQVEGKHTRVSTVYMILLFSFPSFTDSKGRGKKTGKKRPISGMSTIFMVCQP